MIVKYADAVLAAGRTPTHARQRFGAIEAILKLPPQAGPLDDALGPRPSSV